MLTYTEAVKTVDATKATGKLHSLWCAFAHFYDKHGDIGNARVVFQKATQVPLPTNPNVLSFLYVFSPKLRHYTILEHINRASKEVDVSMIHEKVR